jgi:hypothetical protein
MQPNLTNVKSANFEQAVATKRAVGRSKTWYSPGLQLLILGWFLFGFIIAVVSGAEGSYLGGFTLVSLSSWAAFWILSDRPLLNPVQWVAFLIFWWFAVAPPATAFFQLLIGAADMARNTQEQGADSLVIVGLGLPLYATSARLGLKLMEKFFSGYRVFDVSEAGLRPVTILVFYAIGFGAKLVLLALAQIGVVGVNEINFLGGTQTDIWWVGVIALLGNVKLWAISAGVWSWVFNRHRLPLWMKVLLAVMLFDVFWAGIFSGSKGAIILLPFIYAIALTCRDNRPPWKMIAIGAATLVVVVEPLISYGRNFAQLRGASNSQDRAQDFREVMSSGGFVAKSWKDLNVEVFFRGIYPVAGEIARRNYLLSGEWEGYTIGWGIEVVVPRRFRPDKPDQNIGNYFSRTIGADLGIANRNDHINNISPSMMFEFVGNYGHLAGILAFGIIGLCWAIFVSLVVGARSIAQNPFVILLILMGLAFEGSFGAFLVALRDFGILILGVVLTRRFFVFRW